MGYPAPATLPVRIDGFDGRAGSETVLASGFALPLQSICRHSRLTAEDFHLGTSPHRFRTLSVQFACRSLVQVILAAVLAHNGGGIADDDDGVAALQGDGNRAARRVAFFADNASHVGSSS
jgi:hypothetical protein